MRAIYGKVIVKSYSNQKEAIMIKGAGGKMIELWVGRKYVENNRIKNPVICEVIDNNSKYDYIKTGDLLLVHHNYLSEWRTNPFCLEYDIQTGIGIYSFVAGNNIFCKLSKNGKAIAVCENILAERLSNPIKTSLIIVPDTVKQEHEDRVRVIGIAPEVEGVKIGDIVAIPKMADYEICYSWQKKDYSVIKVYMEDLIGVLGVV
jgi:hypothetical protein